MTDLEWWQLFWLIGWASFVWALFNQGPIVKFVQESRGSK